jgi:hypothetical protein
MGSFGKMGLSDQQAHYWTSRISLRKTESPACMHSLINFGILSNFF